ncbi:MAG: 50S ribosomal protein L15 [Betaproteobacteria bacterium]|nr:50S ribosomal protein L15 [Betaproteobacteria bacterium]
MRLNTIKPGKGSKRASKRLGRGVGSGHGKTSSRGHKGQKARAGGFHKVGFEGGQMPLQRRVPKRGFNSLARDAWAEVRLSDLQRITESAVDFAKLQELGIVPQIAQKAKVILRGKLERAVTLKGVAVTKGARAAIEAAGGKIEE